MKKELKKYYPEVIELVCLLRLHEDDLSNGNL